MNRNRLHVVPPSSPEVPEPPGPLDTFGRQLWDAILLEYVFTDPGSTEIAYQACLSRSRAESCRQIIDREGELIRTRTGTRAHPLLREECAARALLARLIQKLGMNLEPVKAIGRPPGR
jgi:hypothetical protein